MTRHDPHSGAARKWIRLATGLATVGVVTLGCGAAVLATGSTATASPPGGKVGVCHRTASESNPYVYISVPQDEANGHITGTDQQHNHQVTWDTDGTWRGVAHKAGDLRLDYYASEQEITARTCFNTTEPTTDPTTPPTTDPTTPPTDEPTDEPSTEPSEDPSDEPSTRPQTGGDDQSTSPDSGDRDDRPGAATGRSDDTNDGTKNDGSSPGVPHRVDAGVSDSTTWGSGLVGGGTALVLSSGGVLLGVRRFEG